ncbi:hypothetical protein NBRC10512_003296 [Rhodotorula toruloides]
MTTLKVERVANPEYKPQPYSVTGYSTFRSFYPYYLGEHSNKICLIGTTIALGTFTRALLAAAPLLAKDPKGRLDALRFGGEGWKSIGELLLGGFVQGVGHFFFELNKPATFKHPFFSFMGDLRLWWEVMTLQRRP